MLSVQALMLQIFMKVSLHPEVLVNCASRAKIFFCTIVWKVSKVYEMKLTYPHFEGSEARSVLNWFKIKSW